MSYPTFGPCEDCERLGAALDKLSAAETRGWNVAIDAALAAIEIGGWTAAIRELRKLAT